MATTATTTLKTNLADYPVTKAIRDGRVTSDIVTLDCLRAGARRTTASRRCCARTPMIAASWRSSRCSRRRCYGKPYVALPIPINGRFQHHCAGFNKELFPGLAPKDIEGKRVGVRTYAQTTGLWIRGILQHEYGVDLDKVTWCTVGEGHLLEYSDPANTERLPKGSDIGQMMLDGELVATLQGVDLPKDPRVAYLVPDPFEAAKDWFCARGRGADQPHVRGPRDAGERAARHRPRDLPDDRREPRGNRGRRAGDLSRRSGSRPTARASSWRSTGRSTRRSSRTGSRSTTCSTRPPPA